MTDRAPFSLPMTFLRSYNAKPAREAGIVCRTCSDDVLDLGRCEANTQYGNLVWVYDAERTLCDIVHGQKRWLSGRSAGSQVVAPAMRAYAAGGDRNASKLMGYARKLGVEPKIRNYMEVLL